MSNFLSPEEMDRMIEMIKSSPPPKCQFDRPEVPLVEPISVPVVEEVSLSPSSTVGAEKPVGTGPSGVLFTHLSSPAKESAFNGLSDSPQAPFHNDDVIDFDGLDIKNPVELLLLLDENIVKGSIKLHDWQLQFMMDFADPKHTKDSPFRAAVQACNGSGKDKYIIAACAVWICMRYTSVECPITSSSGNQLDNQTSAHIERLCHKANALFGPLWKINYRYYEFQHKTSDQVPVPSVIKMFATDEAGKVEGYHPTEAGKKMAIFTSETKSIPDDITAALVRCVGYTHRVDASSPGLAAGYYYNICTTGIPRFEVDNIKSLNSTQTLIYKVTAYDCAHITESEIESFAASLPGGKSSQVFKSGMMAEFGTTDEMVVIPSSFVWRAVENHSGRKKPFDITYIPETYNTAGLDLSDGGAETVLGVRNGNKLIGLECFRFEDTEDSLNYLEELFVKYNLNHVKAKIRGDYCGMGGPMLRSLKRRGWKNVEFIDSRNSASESNVYANRGTELFFNMRKLFENKDVIIYYDKLLIEQLCTRYYKISTKNVYSLLSKLEQRSRGYPSPDRADALNLTFWGYKGTFKETEQDVLTKEPESQIKPKEVFPLDLREWANRSNIKGYVPDNVDPNKSDLAEAIEDYNRNIRQRN